MKSQSKESAAPATQESNSMPVTRSDHSIMNDAEEQGTLEPVALERIDLENLATECINRMPTMLLMSLAVFLDDVDIAVFGLKEWGNKSDH